MTERRVENKKASFKPVESTSIRSLKLDVALVQFIHSHSTIHGRQTGIRMKTIMSEPQFKLISETTIRVHLKSLVARNVLTEDPDFHGSYVLNEGGYATWAQDLAGYMEQILGADIYKTIVDYLRY